MRPDHIENSLLSRLAKSLLLLAFLLALSGTVAAYTVVFRDGHRLEAPAVFTLTATTLTFEAAPGISRTVQLILIDVAATERANNEAPGSFLKHGQGNLAAAPALPAGHAQRTLTNRDLESSRQRRIASEQTYEQRRIELGLPSIAETRRRQAAEEEETLDFGRRRAAAEANDEAYWRGRARTLRNEIVSVDAEINFVRARLGPSWQVPYFNQGFITGGFPSRPIGTLQPGAGRMGTMGAPPARAAGLINLGSAPLRSPRPSARFGRPNFGIGSSFPILPFGYTDNSYDLGLRLNDLQQRRAGLDALWRELENDARMAKAPQVWLAPY